MRASFIRAIYDKKSGFTPTDNAIADILIKKFDFLDKISIKEVADLANCTKPMITNFCKKIGLTGFKQLKKLFIASDHSNTELSKVGVIKSIQTTNKILKSEDVKNLSKAIFNSTKVHIISSGFLKWLGYLFVERMNKQGINAEYIYDKYDYSSPLGDKLINIIISNTGKNIGIDEFVDILLAKKLANNKNTWTISLNSQFQWKDRFPKSIIGFSHNEDLSIFRKTLPLNSINVILHILNLISIDIHHLIQGLENN